MTQYAPLALRVTAAAMSVTSAIAAYPVAASLFGALPAGVAVASSAAVIYAGWHIVGTSDNTDARIVSGALAGVFAVGMVAGIHSSTDLKASTVAKSTANAADTLYINQESTRMATLATVAAELRATQKSKYPAEYERLQAQMQTLTTPTARTVTATQGATFESSSVYRWALSSVFEIVTPALLLLAGMLGNSRATRGQLRATEGQPVGNSRATQEKQPLMDNDQDEGQLRATQGQPEEDEGQLRATQGQPEEDEGQLRATEGQLDGDADTEWQPWGNPLEALSARAVAFDADGYVILAALVSLTDCTQKQARTAFAKAVEIGILTKIGEGNATRYRYANKLRVIK